jgi:tight adherence protein C
VVGVVVAILAELHGSRANPLGYLVLAAVLVLAGVLLRDRALTSEVNRREVRMLAEFPTVAEMLALAVTAGEGPVGALDRVTRLSSGELSRELGRALSEARAGASLVSALETMAARTSLPALARFVDGMAVAVERGTPLAEVLRAQASDVREEGRRAGWVLITLMTAGIVTALWVVAEPTLKNLLSNALNISGDPNK